MIFQYPTRSAGLDHLKKFAPFAGADYAANRNYDNGPEARQNISQLSPFIRHRLISEKEVISATLEHHTHSSAQKFIQEVFWRTYWKGWLEMHPDVWADYCQERDEQHERLKKNSGLNKVYQAAISGKTGVECFDAWAKELTDIGYVHNHARMWFASIWIFTLRLPWVLGADFFYRNLLDGDPASNTLSWRWVAGLHTRGKTYLARPSNIETYTSGRFNPNGLAKDAPALSYERDAALKPLPDIYYNFERNIDVYGLLLSEDDLSFETEINADDKLKAVIAVNFTAKRSFEDISENVANFTHAAVSDALLRARQHFRNSSVADTVWVDATGDTVFNWLQSHDLKKLVISYPPVGSTHDAIMVVVKRLRELGINVVFAGRRWDIDSWPHASKGFFALKFKIPQILELQGLRA